jgi:hypothetical protein
MTIFSLTNITLFTALGLSAIAAWYSILGLTAIFAAAAIPIIVMGTTLEIAKVVTTVWLHRYWDKIKWIMKFYLMIAVLGLALLTSIGVFGFLSKAHIDQGIPTGDVSAKVSILDEKIKTQRENISTARAALSQMDAQVNARLDRGGSEQGAERAVIIRRQQQAERNKLLKEINEAQVIITKLNEERAPIAAELRKVEAEVGPIKYIAALIYDDQTNQDTLERAVRWLILLIVFVFDPLALTLVLASNVSRQLDKDKLDPVIDDVIPTEPIENIAESTVEEPKIAEPEPVVPIKADDFDISKHSYLFTKYSGFKGNAPHIPNPTYGYLPDPIIEEKVEPELPVQEVINPSDTLQDLPKIKGYTELPGGYVNYQGKHMSLEALQAMHPELFLVPDEPKKESRTEIISGFPKNPQINDIHIRTDMVPNRVFNFDGNKWNEVEKEQILYSEKYIQHLIKKIDMGDYDVALLSEREKREIENYLKNIKI